MQRRAAQNAGSPTSPLFGLAGWKFAAPQLVIVSDRRSRKSNDPDGEASLLQSRAERGSPILAIVSRARGKTFTAKDAEYTKRIKDRHHRNRSFAFPSSDLIRNPASRIKGAKNTEVVGREDRRLRQSPGDVVYGASSR
jgi:hypothetical protein